MMHIIRPRALGSGNLTSSTATETVAAWNAATSYALGAKVLRTTTQRIYSCLVAGVNAELPETVGSTRWVDVGPSNRFAMFDAEVGSITTATGGLGVVLLPGAITGLAAQEISGANAVSVVLKDAPGGTTVFSQTVDLEFPNVFDIYDWFFAPYETRGDFQLLDLPEFDGCELSVNFMGVGAVGCGLLAAGPAQEIGSTEAGAKVGRVNYSIKSVNAFGRTTLTKRGSARTMDLQVWIERPVLNRITRLLDQIKDEPCIFIGDEADGLEALIAYGIYKDWSIVIDLPGHCLLNIFIEGFI